MASDLFDDPRVTAMGLLGEVHTGILDKLTPLLTEHKLSLAEFDALIRLARSPEQRLRMSDLAAQSLLSTSGITRVVDRLERRGSVYRQPCPGDRRGSYAVLSDEGVALMETVLPAHDEVVERWFTGLLDERQLTDLLDTLRIVRDAVRPDSTAGVTGPVEETCLGRH